MDDGDPISLLNISIIQAEHLKNYPEAIATIDEYLKKGKKEKKVASQWKKEYQTAFDEQEKKRKADELRAALLKKMQERQAAGGGGDSGFDDSGTEKSKKTTNYLMAFSGQEIKENPELEESIGSRGSRVL